MQLSLVKLAPPLVLNQEVSLQYGFNDEVVFLVALLEQVLLHDCQLGLVDANEAAFGLCNGHFLAYLKVSIK